MESLTSKDSSLCLLRPEHELAPVVLETEIDELLSSLEALDAEASSFLQGLTAKTEQFQKQQLRVVGDRIAEWVKPREAERNLLMKAIKCRQLEERLRRLQNEASDLQQVLQQQQQQISFLRGVDG